MGLGLSVDLIPLLGFGQDGGLDVLGFNTAGLDGGG